MAYLTFYRKYRSGNFDEMVGQEHVVQTLKNAIKMDRLSHAYIFSGPRGTGKTSSARILAKLLNCLSPKNGDPCLTCDRCQKIAKSQAADVIEMDAASHTGVDYIRTLNEQVRYAPVECKYKVYIIDEAHMLSTGAFNALLKTLEEPPAFTLFILATTEPHKLPITIHSRCQHLNFRTLSTDEIQSHLKFIAKEEKISIPDDCLKILARNSSGCMRDGISLLDQLFAFKGSTIEMEDVVLLLGSAFQGRLFDLVEQVLSSNAAEVVKCIHTLFDEGVNAHQFLTDVIQLVQQLLYQKLGLENELEIDPEGKIRLENIANLSTLHQIRDLLEILGKCEQEMRYFPKPKVLLQVRLLQFIKFPSENVVEPVKIAKTPPKIVPKETPPLNFQKLGPPPNLFDPPKKFAILFQKLL